MFRKSNNTVSRNQKPNKKQYQTKEKYINKGCNKAYS